MSHARRIVTMAQFREDNELRWAWGIWQNGRVLLWSEVTHRSEAEAKAAGERFLGLEGTDGIE